MKLRAISIFLAFLLLIPAVATAKGVILNFSDVDIATMVKFISDLTGKNFVMDERVKGKISVYSPSKLSPEEAFNVFTSVLELKGFTVVSAGRVQKIVPTAVAKQSGMKVFAAGEKGPVNESYGARVISLDYISGQEAVGFLQPLVSKDGFISAFGPGNLLLVLDSNLNIEKILGILELIDTEQSREGGEILFLQHASAESIVKVIQEWLGGKGGKAGTGAVSSPVTPVIADPRLNALILFGSDKDKLAIKRLVATMDVPPPTTSSKVNVYYLENADAVETAKVLDGVIKGMTAPQPGQPAAPASPLDARITVTPDKATNALVIMAAPSDYQNLVQVIQKLDRRRRQVFVQAIIAEISLDRLHELGVDWGVMGGASTGSVTAVGAYDPRGAFTSLLSALSAVQGAGITIPDISGTAVNFAVVLKALNTSGALNILSTPSLLTSDNKEAEIFVGENVPFKGKVEISTSSNPSLQSIERKDTGITLKITPQISEGEFVKLDLFQEISAIKDTATTGAADLITTKRSAKTAVVVKDRETVAIGGLIQEVEQETLSKVPLLGDIPYLGWFFKSTSKKRSKTNLLILLTPQIVRDGADLARIANEQQEAFNRGASRTAGERIVPLPQAPSGKPAASPDAPKPVPPTTP